MSKSENHNIFEGYMLWESIENGRKIQATVTVVINYGHDIRDCCGGIYKCLLNITLNFTDFRGGSKSVRFVNSYEKITLRKCRING